MSFDQADIFLLPLLDGHFGVGQVIIPEAQPLCALTHLRRHRDQAAIPVAASEVIALHRVDPASLADGTWPIIGFEQIPDLSPLDRLNALEEDAIDPAILEALVNAWHGLYPWDGFPDPQFFDKLLSVNVKRPKSARTKGQLA